MPPLPADFIHARACKLKCEKILTRPYTLELYAARIFDNPKWVDYEAFAKHYGYQPQSYEG